MPVPEASAARRAPPPIMATPGPACFARAVSSRRATSTCSRASTTACWDAVCASCSSGRSPICSIPAIGVHGSPCRFAVSTRVSAAAGGKAGCPRDHDQYEDERLRTDRHEPLARTFVPARSRSAWHRDCPPAGTDLDGGDTRCDSEADARAHGSPQTTVAHPRRISVVCPWPRPARATRGRAQAWPVSTSICSLRTWSETCCSSVTVSLASRIRSLGTTRFSVTTSSS